MALHGRKVDDRAAAALLHLWKSKMRQQKNAANVDHHAAVPSFRVSLDCGAERMNRGGIYDDVEPSVQFDRLGHDQTDLFRLTDVAKLDPQRQAKFLRFLL